MAVDLPTTGDSKHSFWGTTGTTMSAQKISWSRKMLEFTFMVVVFRVTFRWVCLKIWGNTHSTGCIWMHHDASWCIIIFPMKNDKICFFYFQVPAPNTTSSWLHIYIYIHMYIYIYTCVSHHISPWMSHEIHMLIVSTAFSCTARSSRPVISNARQLFPALEYWVGRGLVHLFIGLQMEGTNSEGMDDAWWLLGGCVPQIPGWEENTLWQTNIAIENGPFIVDLSIENGDFP